MVITLWHGGRGLETDYQEFHGNAKGRWQNGVGLYLAADKTAAQSYAKGARSLYQVQIDLEGFTEIGDALVTEEQAEDFMRRFIPAKDRREFREWIANIMDRTVKLNALHLLNLTVNLDKTPASKTGAMREYFVKELGADYHITSYKSEKLYVIMNPKVIKKVIKAKDLSE